MSLDLWISPGGGAAKGQAEHRVMRWWASSGGMDVGANRVSGRRKTGLCGGNQMPNTGGQLARACSSDARVFTSVLRVFTRNGKKHLTANRDLETGVLVTLAGSSQLGRRQLVSACTCVARAFACVYERWENHMEVKRDLRTVVGVTAGGQLANCSQATHEGMHE